MHGLSQVSQIVKCCRFLFQNAIHFNQILHHVCNWINLLNTMPHFVLAQCLFLWEEHLLELLPKNREENALHAVGKDLGLQATEHQTSNSRLLNHILDHLRIRQVLRVRLLVNLNDADRVGAGITDGRCAESHQCPTAELAQLSVLLGDLGTQEVVCGKPIRGNKNTWV